MKAETPIFSIPFELFFSMLITLKYLTLKILPFLIFSYNSRQYDEDKDTQHSVSKQQYRKQKHVYSIKMAAYQRYALVSRLGFRETTVATSAARPRGIFSHCLSSSSSFLLILLLLLSLGNRCSAFSITLSFSPLPLLPSLPHPNQLSGHPPLTSPSTIRPTFSRFGQSLESSRLRGNAERHCNIVQYSRRT